MPDVGNYEVILSPAQPREGFSGRFEYMDIEIRNLEGGTANDIRHGFFMNDANLHARLTILVGAAEATEIIERLHRGETIRLPGRFTKQELVDMSVTSSRIRTA